MQYLMLVSQHHAYSLSVTLMHLAKLCDLGAVALQSFVMASSTCAHLSCGLPYCSESVALLQYISGIDMGISSALSSAYEPDIYSAHKSTSQAPNLGIKYICVKFSGVSSLAVPLAPINCSCALEELPALSATWSYPCN